MKIQIKVTDCRVIGSIFAPNYDFEVSKGCSATQHINPQGCFVGTQQKLYCVCKLPCIQVSFFFVFHV